MSRLRLNDRRVVLPGRQLHTRPPLDRMQRIFHAIKSGEFPNRHRLAADIEKTRRNPAESLPRTDAIMSARSRKKTDRVAPANLSQVVRDLVSAIPWGHHANLLAKISDPVGQKKYFIDLLFDHRFLKALVAFDLKIGPFDGNSIHQY